MYFEGRVALTENGAEVPVADGEVGPVGWRQGASQFCLVLQCLVCVCV